MAEKSVRGSGTRTGLEGIEQAVSGRTVGGTTINPEVIAALAGVAAKEVEGVAALGRSSMRGTVAQMLRVGGGPSKGVEAEVGEKEAIVDIDVIVSYGASIPVVAENIRKAVADQLRDMAGLAAKEINVNIVGIQMPQKPASRLE